MITTLEQLRVFEDLCILPSTGPGRPRENEVPPEADFGTFNYRQIAIDQGFSKLYEMLNTDFVTEFDMGSVMVLLDDIEKIKIEILRLNKDIKIIHERDKPVFPILYDKNKDTPIYITPEELSPVEFQQKDLYIQLNVLPYAVGHKPGLNYPEFNSVIRMLKTELIPKSRIIIQNVLGNGECLFRSLINGYCYSERGINLGFNPQGSELLVIRMKNIFLQVLQFCLSDKKTQTMFNCSDRFYQTFFELIQQEYFQKGKLTFEKFKENYLQPYFYGGPFECNLFSQLFNYRVNLFSREAGNNKFTFNETFDNRVNKSKDNYGNTINVLNVGGHFMVFYS
jgi:hypothetical protein